MVGISNKPLNKYFSNANNNNNNNTSRRLDKHKKPTAVRVWPSTKAHAHTQTAGRIGSFSSLLFVS